MFEKRILTGEVTFGAWELELHVIGPTALGTSLDDVSSLAGVGVNTVLVHALMGLETASKPIPNDLRDFTPEPIAQFLRYSVAGFEAYIRLEFTPSVVPSPTMGDDIAKAMQAVLTIVGPEFAKEVGDSVLKDLRGTPEVEFRVVEDLSKLPPNVLKVLDRLAADFGLKLPGRTFDPKLSKLIIHH